MRLLLESEVKLDRAGSRGTCVLGKLTKARPKAGGPLPMQYQLRRGSLGERTHQDLILLIPTVDPTVVKSAKKEPVKSTKKAPAPPESGSEAAGLAAPTTRMLRKRGAPSGDNAMPADCEEEVCVECGVL